jgi:mannose-6-phosphate isomerase-like protein (cupin superfamily)
MHFSPLDRRRRGAASLTRVGKTAGMDDKVNLAEKIGLLEQPYSPGIVGYLNDYKLVVVRVKGEFVWHKHDDTDDFFLVLRGRLTIQLRDRDVELSEGELFVVPRGVEHCPKADEVAHVLLIEPRGTRNTGDAGGERTADEVEI